MDRVNKDNLLSLVKTSGEEYSSFRSSNLNMGIACTFPAHVSHLLTSLLLLVKFINKAAKCYRQ